MGTMRKMGPRSFCLGGGEADTLDRSLVLSGLVAVRNGFCLPDEAGCLLRILKAEHSIRAAFVDARLVGVASVVCPEEGKEQVGNR